MESKEFGMKLRVNVFAHSYALMMNMLAKHLTQLHVNGNAYPKHASMTPIIGMQNSASVRAILRHATHITTGISMCANAFAREFLSLKSQISQETYN